MPHPCFLLTAVHKTRPGWRITTASRTSSPQAQSLDPVLVAAPSRCGLGRPHPAGNRGQCIVFLLKPCTVAGRDPPPNPTILLIALQGATDCGAHLLDPLDKHIWTLIPLRYTHVIDLEVLVVLLPVEAQVVPPLTTTPVYGAFRNQGSYTLLACCPHAEMTKNPVGAQNGLLPALYPVDPEDTAGIPRNLTTRGVRLSQNLG